MEKTAEKQRVEAVDIAKGIGILAVVLSHILLPEHALKSYLFYFEVPLFFFLSALFIRKQSEKKDYLILQVKKLYLLYLGVLVLDLVLVLALYMEYPEGQAASLIASLFRYYGKCTVGLKITFVDLPVWFLFSLFLVKILFYPIAKIQNGSLQKILVASTGLVGLCFLLLRNSLDLPSENLYLTTLGCILYFALGFYAKDALLKLDEKLKGFTGKWLCLCGSLLLFALLAIITKVNTYVEVLIYEYGNPLFFLLGSLLGIVAVILLSFFISHEKNSLLDPVKKGLLFCGRKSLPIMVIHYYFIRVIFPMVLKKITGQEQVSGIPAFVLLYILTVALTIGLILAYDKLSKRGKTA